MPEWRTVNLTIGDAFANGHKQVEDVQVRVNVEPEAIQAAYEAGCQKLGVDVINTVAVGYRDNLLPKDVEILLRDHIGRLYLKADRQRGKIVLTSAVWVRIFMYICKLGNEDIRFKTLAYPTLVIGGYGLFDLDEQVVPAEEAQYNDDEANVYVAE
jgi:hypothetical protein